MTEKLNLSDDDSNNFDEAIHAGGDVRSRNDPTSYFDMIVKRQKLVADNREDEAEQIPELLPGERERRDDKS